MSHELASMARESALSGHRGKGRTTALIAACIALDGVFVTHDRAFADYVKAHFPTVNVQPPQENAFRGYRKNVVFDHAAVERLGCYALGLEQKLKGAEAAADRWKKMYEYERDNAAAR